MQWWVWKKKAGKVNTLFIIHCHNILYVYKFLCMLYNWIFTSFRTMSRKCYTIYILQWNDIVEILNYGNNFVIKITYSVCSKMCYCNFDTGFLLMRHLLECTLIWNTKVYHSLETKPWVFTVRFGTQTIGPHKGDGLRRTGPMPHLSRRTGLLKLTDVSVPWQRPIRITRNDVLTLVDGGINRWCLS